MAHIRQSRPDAGLGFQVKDCNSFQVVASSHGSGAAETSPPLLLSPHSRTPRPKLSPLSLNRRGGASTRAALNPAKRAPFPPWGSRDASYCSPHRCRPRARTLDPRGPFATRLPPPLPPRLSLSHSLSRSLSLVLSLALDRMLSTGHVGAPDWDISLVGPTRAQPSESRLLFFVITLQPRFE